MIITAVRKIKIVSLSLNTRIDLVAEQVDRVDMKAGKAAEMTKKRNLRKAQMKQRGLGLMN